MQISIVIPAFNEERLLPQTLAAVNAARPVLADAGWDSELIVCDNNSADRTAEVARAAGASVVFEPVNQISRARNSGAAAATGDWLLFIDADSLPSRELFADMAAAIRSGDCLAGGSTVRFPGRFSSHVCGSLLVRIWNWSSRTRRWVAGSFVFCETSAFREIGGFHPELFAGEELDLSERLKALAAQTGKRIVILHRHPLLTSDRKMQLYSTRECVRLLWRVALDRQQALRNREACHIWYDGRR